MVVKLTGKINGANIILTRTSGDRWETVIPAVPSGVYIVELTAEDSAGNIAFCTRYVLAIDFEKLYLRFEVLDYNANNSNEREYIAIVRTEEQTAKELIEKNYIAKATIDLFEYDIQLYEPHIKAQTQDFGISNVKVGN